MACAKLCPQMETLSLEVRVLAMLLLRFMTRVFNNFAISKGEDFDEVILKFLLSEFKSKEGVDLSKDVFAIQRLREGAEKAKKSLDHVAQYEINLPFISRDKNFSYTLSKAKFNELIQPLVDRTVKPCENALKVSLLIAPTYSLLGAVTVILKAMILMLICILMHGAGCWCGQGRQRNPGGRNDSYSCCCRESVRDLWTVTFQGSKP